MVYGCKNMGVLLQVLSIYVVSSTIVAHKRKYRRVFVRFIEQIFWSKKRKYRFTLTSLEIFFLSERDADNNPGDALSKSNGK